MYSTYMVNISKVNIPYLLNKKNITDKDTHIFHVY